MSTFNYDPKDVLIVYGPLVISGYADGSFVKISANEDDFGLKVGADGEACRVRKRNRSAKIEVTLLQSSLSNGALSAMRSADIDGPLTNVALPMSISTSSGSSHDTPAAWVQKMPDVEYSKDVESRTWIFECGELSSVIAGDIPLA